MEALRKAEEAKSKAAQEENHDAVADSAAASRDAEPEHGPIVINPDPDEEETLASHASESTLELVELEPEPEPEPEEDFEGFEFTPMPTPEAAATPTAGDDIDLDSNSGLSLSQSSYFSRTQNSSNSRLDDDFLDEDDDADQEMQEAAIAREAPRTPAPAARTVTKVGAASMDQEWARRESAGALFQAKEDSQRRRMKKLLSIAAIALVFPLAGIMFWLFTSLNTGSSVQFNVPAAGNLANRSFSDSFSQPEPDSTSDADTLVATETGPGDPGQLADSDSTASTLMAMADNTAEPVTSPTTPRTAPPIPLPQQSTAQNPAPAATIEPAVQEPARTVTSDNTPPQAATAGTAAQTGLSFARSEMERVINPDLVAAYESYQQGDYATAGRLYQQVLATEPNNNDALLHLASVYLKQNNPALARNMYTRLLELNPRDPLARAGILETLQGDPVRQESELKSLISAFPGTPQLSFALGNLYAKQDRWSEAQSAYFDALLAAKSNNTGPVSPDYAFNLAVSLERISQLRSALDYYREAEIQARVTRPGFDPALLQQRLNTLEQRLR